MSISVRTAGGLLALVLFVFPATAVADNSQAILVWPLNPGQGAKKDVLDSVSGVLATEIARTSGRQVLSENEIRSVLKRGVTLENCSREVTACFDEVSASLGVPQVVSGDLAWNGKVWLLHLRRYDVHKEKVISRVTRRIEGSQADLIKDIPGAAALLYEGQEKYQTPYDVENAAKIEAARRPHEYTEWGQIQMIGGSSSAGAGMLGLGLKLFRLRWEKIYWTIVDIQIAQKGAEFWSLPASEVGYKMIFGGNRRHQMYLGAQVGLVFSAASKEALNRKSWPATWQGYGLNPISPHLEYQFEIQKQVNFSLEFKPILPLYVVGGPWFAGFYTAVGLAF